MKEITHYLNHDLTFYCTHNQSLEYLGYMTLPLTLTFTYPFLCLDSLSIDGAGIEGLLPGLPIRLPILSVMKENFLSEDPSWSQFGASAVLKWLIGKNKVLFVVHEFQNFDSLQTCIKSADRKNNELHN